MTGIYGIRNIINQQHYIGQAGDVKARWTSHRYRLRHGIGSPHLQHAWDKYGEEAFEFFVIEECEAENLDEREIYWIKEYDSFRNGYNLTEGGGGMRGYKMSEESKRRISEATKGRYISAEHMDACQTGAAKWRRENPDFGAKKVICLTTGEVFRSRADVKATYPQCESGNLVSHLKGRTRWCGRGANGEKLVWADYDKYLTMTDEDIAELFDKANQKVPLSNGHKESISRALKGKHKSTEHIDKIVKSRAVNRGAIGYWPTARFYVCLNTGEEFSTYEDIIEKTGAKRHDIINHIQHQTPYAYEADGQRYVFVPKAEYLSMSDFAKDMRLFFAAHYIAIKQSNVGKHVVCLNNAFVFPTVRAAAEFAGTSAQSVTNNLKGRVHSVAPDSFGNGLVFVYEDEFHKMSSENISARLEQARLATARAPKYLTA